MAVLGNRVYRHADTDVIVKPVSVAVRTAAHLLVILSHILVVGIEVGNIGLQYSKLTGPLYKTHNATSLLDRFALLLVGTIRDCQLLRKSLP